MRKETSEVYPIFSPPPKPKQVDQRAPIFSPGEYVRVSPSTLTNKASNKDYGWIVDVNGKGSRTIATIKYQECSNNNNTEARVPLKRITVVTNPFEALPRENRLARNQNYDNNTAKHQEITTKLFKGEEKENKVVNITLIERLILSYSCNKGKGWQRRELGMENSSCKDLRSSLNNDVLVLNAYNEGQKKAGKTTAYYHNKPQKRTQLFSKRNGLFNPLSMKYLMYSWGVGKNYYHQHFGYHKRPKNDTCESVNKNNNVIDSIQYAHRFYTPKMLYIQNYVNIRLDNEKFLDDEIKIRRAMLKDDAERYWNSLTVGRTIWEAKAREHLARQPYIKDKIIDLFNMDPSLSYDQCAYLLDNWCSSSTIHKYLKSKEDYCTYVKRILPLLSSSQKKKHVEFAKLFLNCWDLELGEDGKYLFIHYDEKWFYGMVMRANTKMCKTLGIEKHEWYAFHKCHIDKVMVIAFTAFAYQGTITNGGQALKLGLFWCQAARIAKKIIRESTRDEEGKLHYDGQMLRRKGDAYLVDCNITGSNEGTSSEPKFSLQNLFHTFIFPKIEDLVKIGGQYEGYMPVFQGDNAGPHQDKEYTNYATNYCNKKGWKWRPQAPQMPHSNNLDLSVFPCMSKRHTTNLQRRGSVQSIGKEEIWKSC